MKIKRVLFAFMAALLLPVTAMAQAGPTIPTPQQGTAIIVASVFFNGFFGGMGPETTLTLHCTAASVAPDEVVVMDPQAFEFEQAFILSQIPSNIENVCTLTASTLEDYTAEYRCGSNAYSVLDDECVAPPQYGNGTRVDSDISCVFPDIQAAPNQTDQQFPWGDVGGCVINYDVNPVEVVVTKEWDVSNTGGAYYNFDADIKIGCDARMANYTWKKNGWWYFKEDLEDGDYTDGIATITVQVYPEYSESDSTPNECFAVEGDVDSAVEVTSTCGEWNDGTMEIGVGEGDNCTITNTLFFEGIPTLNQYGMAIMALLMLGVGFVGFRRFV